MKEEKHPVKELLFRYIEKSEKKFQDLFSQTRLDEIIDDILAQCYHKVVLMNEKEESLGIGLVIAALQFILDLIFIVLLFGGGLDYYLALVTISYILMPFWAYLFGWYLYGRSDQTT